MGVKFTRDAGERIQKTVRIVEAEFRNEDGHRGRWDGRFGRERWFSLAERLDAGLSADAYAVEWDTSLNSGNGDYDVKDAVSDEVFSVRDTASQHWGLEYEWVLVRSLCTDNAPILEIVQGGATWHKAVLTTTLSPGGSATATVTIRSNAVSVTVWDDFLSAGESLVPGSGGMKIGITYEAENRKWYVTEAPCS